MHKASAVDVALAGDDIEGLRHRHQELERRLAALDRRLSLSPSEQLERVRIKKEKLRIKDQLLVLRTTDRAPARPAR
jgi:uncharacterized protein YdcH (DUF465 family)